MPGARKRSNVSGSSTEIRRIRNDDSFEYLTGLLHRAYAPLAAMGFRYLATDQDVETTYRRASKGECYLVALQALIVGTIVVVPPGQRAPHCDWYDRADVAVLNQFAIEPKLQGRGLASRLLEFAEGRALELGARHTAVDTAQGAAHLIAFYTARGYREVARTSWKHTNYRSVILSKRLREQLGECS